MLSASEVVTSITHFSYIKAKFMLQAPTNLRAFKGSKLVTMQVLKILKLEVLRSRSPEKDRLRTPTSIN